MLISRVFYTEKIENAFRYTPIAVLIGARQVGKTSIMQCYVENKTNLFLNGQDSEVAVLFEKLSIIEQYLQININSELDGLLLIDEFQYINGISTMLKLLTDKYAKLRILASGSSSLDILQKVEESLAGRVRIIEVQSLSFAEFLLFKDSKLHKLQQNLEVQSSNALTAPLDNLLNEYMLYGGFPRVVLADNPSDKTELLNDIYQTYLMRDVRMYIANEHFVGFSKMIRLLSMQIGNLININELSKECRLPYKKCEEYLYLLQKMYIIRLIEPYYSNKRKTVTKMNKIYFYDTGLRNIIYNSFNEMDFRVDNGAIFENYVLLELWRNRRAAGTVQFFRTQSGTEVDFIAIQENGLQAIECKYKRFEKSVSVPNLTNFAKEENIGRQVLININLSATNNEVEYLPAIFTDRMKS